MMGQLNDGAARQLKNRLQEIECSIVRLITENDTFLSSDDMASLRWALSLARITKIRVDKDDPSKDILVGHTTDRYRAELFALISLAINPYGLIDKDKLKGLIKKISKVAQAERHDLLAIFSHMPKEVLDDATRRRPLALTLSGGGGTSYVFIGALHALEESGIIPSVIAGSSMGAILGAYRARTKHFDLSLLESLIERTSWKSVAQPFSGPSRFGVPATFRLYLRDIVGHQFERNGQFLTIADLAIPLRVCVAGLSAKSPPKEEELSRYAHMLDKAKTSRANSKSIISAIIDFAQKPLKPIYLGGDELTAEFDVLDAIGFSAAIPGVFHYDIMRNDPRMVSLVSDLFLREGIIRLIDGGFVDNLPATQAIKAVDQGQCEGFDPFVLSLDGFSPGFNRHLIFYPLMRFAMLNSREGHSVSHLCVIFKNVLSPINLIPTHETLQFALKNGYDEFMVHLPFIRKMIGPIPDPSWIKMSSSPTVNSL